MLNQVLKDQQNLQGSRKLESTGMCHSWLNGLGMANRADLVDKHIYRGQSKCKQKGLVFVFKLCLLHDQIALHMHEILVFLGSLAMYK